MTLQGSNLSSSPTQLFVPDAWLGHPEPERVGYDPSRLAASFIARAEAAMSSLRSGAGAAASGLGRRPEDGRLLGPVDLTADELARLVLHPNLDEQTRPKLLEAVLQLPISGQLQAERQAINGRSQWLAATAQRIGLGSATDAEGAVDPAMASVPAAGDGALFAVAEDTAYRDGGALVPQPLRNSRALAEAQEKLQNEMAQHVRGLHPDWRDARPKQRMTLMTSHQQSHPSHYASFRAMRHSAPDGSAFAAVDGIKIIHKRDDIAAAQSLGVEAKVFLNNGKVMEMHGGVCANWLLSQRDPSADELEQRRHFLEGRPADELPQLLLKNG